MRKVNLDAAGQNEYEYLRGHLGLLPPPHYHLAVCMARKLYDVADEVAEAIVVSSCTSAHRRPPHYLTPDVLTEKLLDISREQRGKDKLWWAVMEVALWLAKLDPRYWGVRSPSTELYCSPCKRGRSQDEFTHSESRCDRHYPGGVR